MGTRTGQIAPQPEGTPMSATPLFIRPADAETAAALTPDGDAGRVTILITREEYQAHRAAEDTMGENDMEDALGNVWTPVTDQFTNTNVLVTRASCGAGCRCDILVKLK